MFENLMRKKFYEGNLFVQKNNDIKNVDNECSFLHLVQETKRNRVFDYIDGVLTIKEKVCK